MHAKRLSYITLILALIVGLCATALPASGVNAAASGVAPAMLNGANRLTALQNNDGGWDWPLDDGNPASVSPKNTVGPIAKGLALAYLHTGNTAHRTALLKAGVLLLAKANNFSPSDGYLAVQLDAIFGGTAYKDHVVANFYAPLAAGTYDRNGAGTLYTTAAYVNLIRTGRESGIPPDTQANMAAWDVGMGLVGAAACGASTAEWIAGVEGEINELNGANFYDVIGLAGALYGLAYVSHDFDPTAGQHAAATNLADLAAILAGYQISNGGFSWSSLLLLPGNQDEAIQETAYAVLALNQVNRALYLAKLRGAADYMLSVQLGTGGWANDTYYNQENNEVTAEALWGISVAYPELWVCPTGDCAHPGASYNTIQAALNAIPVGGTIYVAAGTYAGNININKSVTLLGDPGDASAGPGVNAPVIDGGSAPGDAFLIHNGVSNVTISGFVMQNFTSPLMNGIGNGISAWEASTSNVTVQDNFFHHLGYNGVLVGNDKPSSNWTDPSRWGDHTNWLIKNNIIEDFGYIGFELTNTSNSSIENNVIHLMTPYIGAIFSSARRSETGLTIKNNLIDGTPSTAYPVVYVYAYDLDMPNPNLNSVLIEGNTISTVGTPFQVYIRNIGTGTVTGVTIRNNRLSSLRNLTAATINASPNWWGSIAGPTTGQVNGVANTTPWCAVADCTILNPNILPPGTTAADIQAAINSALPGTIIIIPAGTYTLTGGLVINTPNLTIILAPGAVIQNNSPCFTVNASYTTIKSQNIGGGKCVPTGSSNGIDVAADLTNIVIEGIEFDGAGQTTGTGDGINFAGAITDVQIIDNYFHGLRGDGVHFVAQPTGTVQIQGNLFKNNTGLGVNNAAGTATINAEYNAWGAYAGAAAGDGISTFVDADPWTHVDLYMTSSGTPWANQVVRGDAITYTVKANLQNVMGADFTLTYPSALTLTGTTLGSYFTTPANETPATVLDTSVPGVIKFAGSQVTPVSGADLVLFTATFNGTTAGTGAMDFVDTTDAFSMFPGYGPSTFIYADALVDGTVKVIDLPSITSSDLVGYYLTGVSQELNIRTQNPTSGGTYTNVLFNFRITGAALADIATFKSLVLPSTWVPVPLTVDGTDLIGSFGPSGGFPIGPGYDVTTKFRVTFNTAKSYPVVLTLNDLNSAPANFVLASLNQTAVVYTQPTITSANLVGPYLVGIPQAFSLAVTNPSPIPGPFELQFNFPAGTVLVYNSTTYPCTGGVCTVPVTLSAGTNNLSFTVTFMAAYSGSITVSLYDSDWLPADRLLATLTQTGVIAYGNITVTGTVSMQGRTTRAGVPMTLTALLVPYGPFNATSINVISNNISYTNVAEGSYRITTNQPRYLNVTADLAKIKAIAAGSLTITALELKSGNAIWRELVGGVWIPNTIINAADASLIGTHYGHIADEDADVNFSGKVDIFDLALVGGNFDMISATAYADWTP